MDTSDAQASLGSDGIIESYPTSALNIECTSVIETSTKIQSPVQSKISVSVFIFPIIRRFLNEQFRYHQLQKLYIH
jgi:hypothetical protein